MQRLNKKLDLSFNRVMQKLLANNQFSKTIIRTIWKRYS